MATKVWSKVGKTIGVVGVGAALMAGLAVSPSQGAGLKLVKQRSSCSFQWTQVINGRLQSRTDWAIIDAIYTVKPNGDIVKYNRRDVIQTGGALGHGMGIYVREWTPNNHVVYVGWPPRQYPRSFWRGNTQCYMLFNKR